MTTELICITCPIGCHLKADRLPNGELAVEGNRCSRGAVYAREELLSPKRVVTATVRLACEGVRSACPEEDSPSLPHALIRRVPVRTTAPFPKEAIPELLKAIYAVEAPLPVKRGDILISNALGTGIDLIATRSIG